MSMADIILFYVQILTYKEFHMFVSFLLSNWFEMDKRFHKNQPKPKDVAVDRTMHYVVEFKFIKSNLQGSRDSIVKERWEAH